MTDDQRTVAARPHGRTHGGPAADHASIDRLAEELLPALIAKLAASGLGEIEVGEGAWTVRVRRPAGAADGAPRPSRRPTARRARSPATPATAIRRLAVGEPPRREPGSGRRA